MIATSLHNPDLIVALCNHIRAHGEYLGEVRKGNIWAFAWACEFAGTLFGLERTDHGSIEVSKRSFTGDEVTYTYPSYMFELVGSGWSLRFRFVQTADYGSFSGANWTSNWSWKDGSGAKRLHDLPGAMVQVWVDNRDAYREEMTLLTMFSDRLGQPEV